MHHLLRTSVIALVLASGLSACAGPGVSIAGGASPSIGTIATGESLSLVPLEGDQFERVLTSQAAGPDQSFVVTATQGGIITLYGRCRGGRVR